MKKFPAITLTAAILAGSAFLPAYAAENWPLPDEQNRRIDPIETDMINRDVNRDRLERHEIKKEMRDYNRMQRDYDRDMRAQERVDYRIMKRDTRDLDTIHRDAIRQEYRDGYWR